LKYYNILENPIKIHGLAVTEPGKFHRLPDDVIGTVNDGVTGLAKHTAGACVRFNTDSKTVEVKVKLIGGGMMGHMPLSGMSGVDIYFGDMYCGSVYPNAADVTEYSGTVNKFKQAGDGICTVTVNLPLYNGVKDVTIGISDEANIYEPTPYRIEKPILFYGSSITQGGCASRPGNAYPALLSRWLDTAHINLGFSGSARGEESIARYIGSLDLSAFIMDYDHNAPSVEHLKETHYKFYRIVRGLNPMLPIIFVSKPDPDNSLVLSDRRREVIYNTYGEALKTADKYVNFIDGAKLFGDKDRLSCTVDTCHPNDLGFFRMAEVMAGTLRDVLGL